MRGLLSVLVVAAILLWAAAVLPGWWAGRRGSFGERRDRHILPAVLILASLAAGLAVGALRDAGVLGPAASRVLGLLCLVLAGLAGVSTLTIHWFNRPRFLIPPWRRDRPGRLRPIQERRRREARRRSV